MATAALDKRITFLGVVHDAMCDFEAEMHDVGGGWPHYFYWDVKNGTNKELLNMKVEGARYYDGVNFARRVTQPGWYSFGYTDVFYGSLGFSPRNPLDDEIIEKSKQVSEGLFERAGH